MKFFVIVFLAVFACAFGAGKFFADPGQQREQRNQQRDQQQPTIQRANVKVETDRSSRSTRVEVRVRPRTELRRFSAPVTTVPSTRPPNRPGHHWRWHRWHGWVAIPVAVAPPTILLPNNYTLPQQVVAYERVGAQTLSCTCPHCGMQINLTVQ